MYQERRDLFEQLEQARNSRILVYITGDRPGMETKMHAEVFDFFVNHLDGLEGTEKISLYLYTRGGNTLAAWGLVNLIRQFCNEFEVIIPSKAHSAGTLVCLGANGIIMTKQATLGPIDPSVNTALNPQVPGAPPDAKVPVSVEAIKGFLDLAKTELKIKRQNYMTEILSNLTDKIHPLVLGEVYRATSQIQMLARKLISGHINDERKIKKIISFLCSESGSHDYTIHRDEARDELGLNIETPNDNLYSIIKSIYDDIESELELTSKFDPFALIGGNNQLNYSVKRALIESVAGGSHFFITEGVLTTAQAQIQRGVMQNVVNDQRTFEGWRHETI